MLHRNLFLLIPIQILSKIRHLFLLSLNPCSSLPLVVNDKQSKSPPWSSVGLLCEPEEVMQCLLKGQSRQKENCIFVFTQIKKLKLPGFKKGLRLKGTWIRAAISPWNILDLVALQGCCPFSLYLNNPFIPASPIGFIEKMNTVVELGNLLLCSDSSASGGLKETPQLPWVDRNHG